MSYHTYIKLEGGGFFPVATWTAATAKKNPPLPKKQGIDKDL